jgi:hypothetical protein
MAITIKQTVSGTPFRKSLRLNQATRLADRNSQPAVLCRAKERNGRDENTAPGDHHRGVIGKRLEAVGTDSRGLAACSRSSRTCSDERWPCLLDLCAFDERLRLRRGGVSLLTSP